MNRFKKLAAVLLTLPLMVGCAESEPISAETTAESPAKIALTMSNYSDYIATYSYVVYATYSGSTYWNFYGSTLCKFYEPVIHYSFQDKEETCKLTISGCGQMLAISWSTGYSYSATITDVTGYVQVLY